MKKIKPHKFPPRLHLLAALSPAVKKIMKYYAKKQKDFGYNDYFEKNYCQAFSKYLSPSKKAYTDAVNSGTNAVYIALRALNLPKKSTIICSAITDPGMISPIILCGFKLKVADNQEGKPYTNLEEIKKKINKSVTCILLNHHGGYPIPEMQQIANFARLNKIKLIEDCSQAHGANIHKKKVGSYGDISVFSTMFSKMHSSGGTGGLIFTNQKKLYNKIIMIADKGKSTHLKKFNARAPGNFAFPALNFNQNEISCAIGHETLKKLEATRKTRINILNKLNRLLLKVGAKTTLYLENIESASPYFGIAIAPHLSLGKKQELAKKISINPNYLYNITEWKLLKAYAPQTDSALAAKKFRKITFNINFNENYKINDLIYIANCIKKVEMELD